MYPFNPIYSPLHVIKSYIYLIPRPPMESKSKKSTIRIPPSFRPCFPPLSNFPMFLQATTGWKKPQWSPNSPQVPRTRDDPLKNGFFQTPSCGKQPKSCQPNMGILLILDYFNQQKHRFSWFSLIEVKKNGFIPFFPSHRHWACREVGYSKWRFLIKKMIIWYTIGV